jgi:hypothetical protein
MLLGMAWWNIGHVELCPGVHGLCNFLQDAWDKDCFSDGAREQSVDKTRITWKLKKKK